MAVPSETFNFAYQVTFDGTNLIASGTDLTGPLGETITDIVTNPGDNPGILGDVFQDQIAGALTNNTSTGAGTYLGLASNAFNGSNGILVQSNIDHNFYYLTNVALTDVTGSHGDLAFQLQEDVLCFMPGTMIRTPEGESAVETLKRGDLVTTTDGRAVPVRWVGRETIATRFADPLRFGPIRIKAGALAETVPARDLLLSPDHAILLDGVLVQASALVNGTSIVRESNVPDVFTYYHVEVDDHSLILADNVPAETFVDNVGRHAFDNWVEHETLYPNGRAIVEMNYPRAKAYRQVPRIIREKLAARGLALYGASVSSAA